MELTKKYEINNIFSQAFINFNKIALNTHNPQLKKISAPGNIKMELKKGEKH